MYFPGWDCFPTPVICPDSLHPSLQRPRWFCTSVFKHLSHPELHLSLQLDSEQSRHSTMELNQHPDIQQCLLLLVWGPANQGLKLIPGSGKRKQPTHPEPVCPITSLKPPFSFRPCFGNPHSIRKSGEVQGRPGQHTHKEDKDRIPTQGLRTCSSLSTLPWHVPAQLPEPSSQQLPHRMAEQGQLFAPVSQSRG